MIRSFIRQRLVSIQRTIETKQNCYLTLHDYLQQQTNWSWYFPVNTKLISNNTSSRIIDSVIAQAVADKSYTSFEDDIKKATLSIYDFHHYYDSVFIDTPEWRIEIKMVNYSYDNYISVYCRSKNGCSHSFYTIKDEFMSEKDFFSKLSNKIKNSSRYF